MRISLLFPILAIGVMRIRAKAAIFTGLAISLLASCFAPEFDNVSASDSSLVMMFHWIAFFVLGAVLASNLTRIDAWWKRTATANRRALLAGAMLLYFGDGKLVALIWTGWNRLMHRPLLGFAHDPVMNWVTALGGAGLIVAALGTPSISSPLKSPPFQFFGRISYSLYLVHPLVLLTLARGFQDRLSLWAPFFLYISGSVLFAWAFCLAVEEPFMRWSRSIAGGRRMPPSTSSSEKERVAAA